ncbi:MAG: FAD-dependent oxidoreductase [Elusimicrobia bacterium]|nr:FAD-dependent oxidoreductase [Elusimicrobiota bacterium]
MNRPGKRIAVIGAGMAGLTAAYYLSRRHSVAVFEKSGRIGGNAYSHRTAKGAFLDVAVAAFGKAGYPNFYALLEELDIPAVARPGSYMSFHDLDSKRGLYMTLSAEGARLQGLDLLRPANLRSLARFFVGLQRAQRLMVAGRLEGVTLGRCLQGIPEFSGDARLAFLSTLCLLSSMEAREVLASPAAFFFGKLRTHHDVISPKALYSVRCVRDGTRRYVNALAAPYRRSIRLDARIRAVERGEGSARVVLEDGSVESFDAVVFACNPDQALALLAEPTPLERRLLGAWRYKEGRVVVHRDHSSFPPRALIEAYTFLYRLKDGALETSVNGALWREPQAPEDCELISAQHPNYPIREDLVELDLRLRTPLFGFDSCATIPELPRLNQGRASFFCGSYFGYGLHEDAVASAKRVAQRLGCA